MSDAAKVSRAALDEAGPQYLSRGTDHLGSLQRTLRDLIGYRTLANELIQNADDAGSSDDRYKASEILFAVESDALRVENDGFFSDCGQVEDDVCAWESETHPKCDFHRFRTVASGDKRKESSATGAFGIGFTAVYQVTDYPEVISAGRHWVVDELAKEDQRINVCPGCANCRAVPHAGTRFILPFAVSPESELRKRLHVPPFAATDRDGLATELETLLPDSLLFLKTIDTLALRVDGTPRLRLQRIKVEDGLLVDTGTPPGRVWYREEGDFAGDAEELRRRFPQIEERRRHSVSIAFSDEVDARGLLYAFLPTQQRTGLPFHINADFFPSSNRKEIVLESDYQSEWNRAAIAAAARLVARSFSYIRPRLEPIQLWNFIHAVYEVQQAVKQGKQDRAFGEFWEMLLPVLQTEPIIVTTTGISVPPTAASIEYSQKQRGFVPVFEAVGIPTPHEDIWSRVADARLRSALGVGTINASRVHKAFEQKGLTRPLPREQAPALFQHDEGLGLVWSCVEALLTDRATQHDRKYLSLLSIVPCEDGTLRPAGSVYRADGAIVTLFRRIDGSIPFCIETPKTPPALKELVPTFTVEDALSALEKIPANSLGERFDGGLELTLLHWLGERKAEIRDKRTRQRIAALSLFPSTSGLFPLTDLALPGDFKDELGLANLLDTPRLAGLRDFLVELGAEELTFQRYVRSYLPLAFQVPTDAQSVERKLKAIELLAERMGAIEDNATGAILQRLPLIKCTDGVFRRPAEVYFGNQLNVAILGPNIHRAAWSKDSPLKESVSRLYRWLGVSPAPRDEDLVARIKSLATPGQESREWVPLVLKHLHEKAKGDGSWLDGNLSCLRTVPWLPAKGNQTRWYRPHELFLEFRSYLFSSQAEFIDLPPQLQRDYSTLLQALGLRTEPDVLMVVRHLLRSVEKGLDIKEEIYRFLNENATDARVRMLQGKRCIFVPGRGWFRPDQVFWSEHQFGAYRQHLGQSLRRYSDLFEILGVREKPGPSDARKVLLEVHGAKGQMHLPLGDDLDVVMNCWRLLSSANDEGQDIETELDHLRDREVVPDARGILARPCWLYFDDRVGLKAKFGCYLENNLVLRPAGADSALRLVGVRSINEVVEAQLTHQPNAIVGFDLLQHVVGRKDQLNRVFAFHGVDTSGASIRINSVEFRCVDEIRVRYLAHVFALSEPVPSVEESLQAHFDGSDVFFYVGSGELAWREIAKELALLVSPDREPGLLAASIKEVLASSSPQEAESFLNDLGFPPASVTIGEVPEQAPVEQIGNAEGAFLAGSSGDETPSEEGAGGSAGRVDGAGRIGLGGTQAGIGTSSGTSATLPKGSSGQSQNRLPVYVGSGTDHSEPMAAESLERLREVDTRGIERVMQAEREAGRHPRSMPHNHPGFDIESANEDGDIERLIEVKSTAATWRERGVALSREQFNHAEDAGTKYWLYVVEKALDDDFVVHRIQNPAKKANEFVYDGGWKLLSSD